MHRLGRSERAVEVTGIPYFEAFDLIKGFLTLGITLGLLAVLFKH